MIVSLPNELIIYIILLKHKLIIKNNIENWFYYKHQKSKKFNIIIYKFYQYGFDIHKFELYSKIRWEWRHALDDWVSMILLPKNEVENNLTIIYNEAENGYWGIKNNK
tara:strand:+ start:1858 stop:2181 length:324 start_codon:yes stop_codon:yes gene_type:complete